MRPTTSGPRMMLGMVSANVDESCAASGAAAAARRAMVTNGRMVTGNRLRGERGRLERNFGGRDRSPAAQHENPFARGLDHDHDDGNHEERRDGGVQSIVEDEAAGVGGGRAG